MTSIDARGTGLGLTFAEGIVSQNRGSTSAANQARCGACLDVRFPHGKVRVWHVDAA